MRGDDRLLDNSAQKIDVKCVKDSFIILYHNGEWEEFTGGFEECIRYVKTDRRYKDYGHDGATIVGYAKMYQVHESMIERVYI